MGWEGPFLNLAFVWEGLGLGRRTEGQGVRGYYCPSQGVDHGGNDLAQVKIDSEPDENEGTLVSPARLEYYPKSITTLLYFLTSNLRPGYSKCVGWEAGLCTCSTPHLYDGGRSQAAFLQEVLSEGTWGGGGSPMEELAVV